MFKKMYGNVWDGNDEWNAIPVTGGELYDWSDASTYMCRSHRFSTELTL